MFDMNNPIFFKSAKTLFESNKMVRLTKAFVEGTITTYFFESLLLFAYAFASVGGLLCLAFFIVTKERKYINKTFKYLTFWIICEGVAVALCLV